MAKRVQETTVGDPKRRRMDAHRQVTLRNNTLQLLTKLGVKSCPNITVAFSTISSRNVIAVRPTPSMRQRNTDRRPSRRCSPDRI